MYSYCFCVFACDRSVSSFEGVQSCYLVRIEPASDDDTGDHWINVECRDKSEFPFSLQWYIYEYGHVIYNGLCDMLQMY